MKNILIAFITLILLGAGCAAQPNQDVEPAALPPSTEQPEEITQPAPQIEPADSDDTSMPAPAKLPPTITEEATSTAETQEQPAIAEPETPTSNETSDPPSQTVQNVVIRFDGNSFSPASITINKGDTVTFINDGNRPTWPASDAHPTHGNYPEAGGCIGSAFDACEGIQPGGTYQFTFNKTGTWTYHDHMKPSAGGSIIVK